MSTLLGKNPLAMNERRQAPLRRFTFTRLNPERRDTERRESPRFPVTANVRFLRAAADGPDVIDGDVMEASLTGMRVVLDKPVRKNEQLLVEVTSELHGGFNITAQIMWVESTPEDCYIAGCEFCSILSLKQRAQLQRLAELALAACS
ncbi:MAG: PilZ domain-containing protein [Planctomycetaceae bacterium]|nr:PilZ domain-containing protein [Planctomycetaceae bacterium]